MNRPAGCRALQLVARAPFANMADLVRSWPRRLAWRLNVSHSPIALVASLGLLGARGVVSEIDDDGGGGSNRMRLIFCLARRPDGFLMTRHDVHRRGGFVISVRINRAI